MELIFGKYQTLTSERMSSHPRIGHFVKGLFGYTNLGNYARSLTFRKMVKKLPMENFSSILDLGCGYGEFSYTLAEALPNSTVHAVDIDSQRIGAVNRTIKKANLTNIKTHLGKIETLEQQDLDFIFSVDVFEHIPVEEMPFEESRKKLKNGGYMLVKIPTEKQRTIFPESWFEEHQDWLEEEHVGQVYDLDGLKNRFIEEGFKIIHASYSDGWLSRLGWELAYLGKKAGVITQLASLVLAKGLVRLDKILHRGKWGNAIQVIGQKVES